MQNGTTPTVMLATVNTFDMLHSTWGRKQKPQRFPMHCSEVALIHLGVAHAKHVAKLSESDFHRSKERCDMPAGVSGVCQPYPTALRTNFA